MKDMRLDAEYTKEACAVWSKLVRITRPFNWRISFPQIGKNREE